MKDYWCTAFLIFIMFYGSSQANEPQAGNLTCVNDYLKNISCVWWNYTDFSTWTCQLQGVRNEKYPESCELLPLNSHSYFSRGCDLIFHMNFIFYDEIKLNVFCNGSLITTDLHKPAKHIKTQPPDRPIVNGTKILWSRGVNFPNDIDHYEFQIQFKPKHWKWELVKPRASYETQMVLDLENLTTGEEYEFRVRVKPIDRLGEGHFHGYWSDWSPAVSWRSTVNPPPVLPDDTRTILIIGIHLLLAIVGISLIIIYKTTKNKGLLKPKNQHVPDPSKYFQPLHTIHEGNFRKWLCGQNSIEPFINPLSCDDISPVEVSDIRDVSFMDPKAWMSTAGLPHSNQMDSGLENSGTSHASSSCFSNMGYLYSKSYTGSMHLETCPVYFTYNPEEDLNSAFSSSSSLYDGLQSPPFQMDDQMSPDSGFDMPERCEEDKDDIVRHEDGNPLVSYILSLSQGSMGCVRTAESFPLASVTIPWSEPVISPSCTSAFQPEEDITGRPSSLIEPCGGGYLTLKDMQKFSNKSI